jgi:GntR family transcriptional regulator / MocR family aminotransferase
MKRTTSAPELLVNLQRQAGVPLRAQLEQELRSAIRAGRLHAGREMPATRVLARDLGISRGLVVEAYEQLLAEGYLTARRGSATTVAAHRPNVDATVQRHAREEPVAPPRLDFDFRPGVPDMSMFPRRAWLASLRRTLQTAGPAAFAYPDVRGPLPMRTALADYLNRARGTVARPDLMLSCTGFTQGFRLACRALRERGVEALALEDPAHLEMIAAMRSEGLKAISIPVDERGVIVERLKRTEAGAVLLTPAHQFPTGAVLAPERRAELIDWATTRGAWVIEDDYDAEYRYDRDPVGSLQGVAPGQVVYIGSASKTLAPALRVGWMLLPPALVPEVTLAKHQDDCGSPALQLLAFGDFVARGELDRHLRRMRAHYRRRRDALVTALRARLPRLRVSGIAAGLHLMLELEDGTDEQAVVEAAAALSVGVYRVGAYRARSTGRPALILGYGATSEATIVEGIKRLASVLRWK